MGISGGNLQNENIKPIRILKYGRRAKSLFKYELEEIQDRLSNPFKREKFFILKIFHVLKGLLVISLEKKY